MEGRCGAAPMVPRYRVVDASLLVSAVSRKEPWDGGLTHGPGACLMSTETSVPQPRLAGLDVSDSALLATLLREAPIGFAFFGTDLRFRRINRSLARLHGRNGSDHLGLLPSLIAPRPQFATCWPMTSRFSSLTSASAGSWAVPTGWLPSPGGPLTPIP